MFFSFQWDYKSAIFLVHGVKNQSAVQHVFDNSESAFLSLFAQPFKRRTYPLKDFPLIAFSTIAESLCYFLADCLNVLCVTSSTIFAIHYERSYSEILVSCQNMRSAFLTNIHVYTFSASVIDIKSLVVYVVD